MRQNSRYYKSKEWDRQKFNDFLSWWVEKLSFLTPNLMHSTTIRTCLQPRTEDCLIVCLVFETITPPKAKTHCWISKFRRLTGNTQLKSFGPCLFIFKFHDYIPLASKNSITVWKTINQPPIDSSKTITEKST